MNLISARYTHELDVYSMTETRDPDTGQTKRVWSVEGGHKDIPCQARGVVSEGIRTVGSTQDFRSANRSYTEEDWVKVRTPIQLSKEDLVGNIRYRLSHEAAWIEDDGETPVIFSVMGSQPIIGPFGRVMEFESTLFRKQDAWEDVTTNA